VKEVEIAAILATLVPALIPSAIDAIKGIFGKITGIDPAAPKSVADTIQLMDADTKRLEALAKLDNPVGEPSQWVVDLRSSFRYIAVAFIVVTTVIYNFIPDRFYNAETDAFMRQICGSAVFFILGDRVNIKLKNGGK
jgi:hypothetical protein